MSKQFNKKSIFMNLGIAVFIALIFMIVMFSGERLGTQPWLSLSYMPGMTEAENIILFVASVIFAFFIAITLINIILFSKKSKKSNKKGRVQKTPQRKKKQTKKTPTKKRGKKSKGKIDGYELSKLITFTLIFFIFVILINGWVETRFPGVQYWGSVPIKLSEGILFIAFALWGLIMAKFGISYMRD
jgi:hypothetical protein